MSGYPVPGARHHEHITTPIPATLHWFPGRQRVIFKMAPHYLADLCVPTVSTDGRRQSRSAVSRALLVP